MKIQEGMTNPLDELSLDTPDQELISITDEYETLGTSSMADRMKEFEQNKIYYFGKQTGKDNFIKDNRIFLSVETIVPIATADVPAPNVVPTENEVEAIDFAKTMEKILISMFKQKPSMQKKIERAIRHLLLAKICIFRVYYCPVKKRIETRVVHPSRILFNNDRDIENGFDWIGERVTKTANEIIEDFIEYDEKGEPTNKKNKELLDYIKAKVNNKMSSHLTYTEYWTPTTVVYRLGKMVLRKIKNPTYDFKNDNKNFMLFPDVPYVVSNIMDLGEEIFSATSLVEQAQALQDGVNKTKNQIDRNKDIVNGKVVGTGRNGLKKEEFSQIDWTDPKEGIFMADGEKGDIERIMGQPLPQFVQMDLDDSRNEIDQIMGTNATTRGVREGRETAEGRRILRSADTGRIDLIGRRMEEAIEHIFNWWVQLIKIYYGGKRLITYVNEDKTRQFIEFSGDDIKDIAQIEVVPGSLIPEDKGAKQERALTLANAQLIDPISLYRDLGYKNPEERAKNLYLWQNDPTALFADMEGDAEGSAKQQVQQANEESIAMAQGGSVPPFENADANNIAFHNQFMNQPEFAQLDTATKKRFIAHVRAEAESVQNNQKENI